MNRYVMQHDNGSGWFTCGSSFGANANRPGKTTKETTDINEAFICLSYWQNRDSSQFRIIEDPTQ